MAGGEDETHISCRSPNAFLAQRETSCQGDVHHFDLGRDFQAEIETLAFLDKHISSKNPERALQILLHPVSQLSRTTGRRRVLHTAVLELQRSLCWVRSRDWGGGSGLRLRGRKTVGATRDHWSPFLKFMLHIYFTSVFFLYNLLLLPKTPNELCLYCACRIAGTWNNEGKASWCDHNFQLIFVCSWYHLDVSLT